MFTTYRQLVIAKGLVLDRVQQLNSGGKEANSVIALRRARNSYGVVCRKMYDPKNRAHFGEKPDHDRRDGITYMEDQIEWLIKGVCVSSIP